MRPGDLPEIMEIERLSHVEPWKESFFLEELDRPQSRVLVAREESSGKVLGYVCAWRVADELQIFNVAVHPAYRRRSVGRRLLLAVLEDACADRVRTALLEVRRGNHAAQRFYASLGFKPVGLRPHYYGGDGTAPEPAVLMELEMDPRWRAVWLSAPKRKP